MSFYRTFLLTIEHKTKGTLYFLDYRYSKYADPSKDTFTGKKLEVIKRMSGSFTLSVLYTGEFSSKGVMYNAHNEAVECLRKKYGKALLNPDLSAKAATEPFTPFFDVEKKRQSSKATKRLNKPYFQMPMKKQLYGLFLKLEFKTAARLAKAANEKGLDVKTSNLCTLIEEFKKHGFVKP